MTFKNLRDFQNIAFKDFFFINLRLFCLGRRWCTWRSSFEGGSVCSKLVTGQRKCLNFICKQNAVQKGQTAQRSQLPNLPRFGKQVLHNSCFSDMSVRYAGPGGWRLDAPTYRGYWGLCRQSPVSVISVIFGSFVPVLPAYSGNIYSFSGLCWSWRLDSQSLTIKLKL